MTVYLVLNFLGREGVEGWGVGGLFICLGFFQVLQCPTSKVSQGQNCSDSLTYGLAGTQSADQNLMSHHVTVH